MRELPSQRSSCAIAFLIGEPSNQVQSGSICRGSDDRDDPTAQWHLDHKDPGAHRREHECGQDQEHTDAHGGPSTSSGSVRDCELLHVVLDPLARDTPLLLVGRVIQNLDPSAVPRMISNELRHLNDSCDQSCGGGDQRCDYCGVHSATISQRMSQGGSGSAPGSVEARRSLAEAAPAVRR